MRDPYAPVLDWIDGGELPWSRWKKLHGGGLLSWLRWEGAGGDDQDEIRAYWHDQMMDRGEAHVYRGVYYDGSDRVMDQMPPTPPPLDRDPYTDLKQGLPWWAASLMMLAGAAVVAYGMWAGWH